MIGKDSTSPFKIPGFVASRFISFFPAFLIRFSPCSLRLICTYATARERVEIRIAIVNVDLFGAL